MCAEQLSCANNNDNNINNSNHSSIYGNADPLLVNPALFSDLPPGQQPWAAAPATRGCVLLQQYLDLVDAHPPTHPRMMRAHTHRLLGDWLQVGRLASDHCSPPGHSSSFGAL